MHQFFLPIHSFTRWLVLAALLYCIISAVLGLLKNKPYSRLDNIVRSASSGLSHLQLLMGMVLYMKSPVTKFFMQHPSEGFKYPDVTFFGLIHITLMLTSVVLITIGAAKARRKTEDADKHKAILIWFGIALLIIFIAIPWPFNPLAARPIFRGF